MKPGDVRQWRFRASGTQVRAEAAVVLHNDALALDLTAGAVRLPPAEHDAEVTLHRPGCSPRPVCGGERVAVHLAGAGYLAAGEPGGPEIVLRAEPSVEWVVTAVAPGVAVPVGKPVALFDVVQGDHLVCRPGLDAPVLGWAGGDPLLPAVTLPIPPQFRPPEGVPGDVELSGAVVPVRDGDPAAGLLLLLDPADGLALGGHLGRRVPAVAERLAPESAVGAVACRWSAAGAPIAEALPAAGARLWVHGLLVADPGISVRPVRALAWALDGDGEPVTAAPGDADWPQTTLTWWVVLPPSPDGSAATPGAFFLPLPGRDGEPGSATTIRPATDRGAGRYAERRGAGGASGAAGDLGSGVLGGGAGLVGGTTPALVAGVAGSRRMLRMATVPGLGGGSVARGCTVRVHLPGSTSAP